MFIEKKLLERIEGKKKLLDKVRPLSKPVLKQLEHEMEIEWTYNSNAIEGNSLSLQETRLILERGITIGGKSLKEHFEAIDHKKAIDFVEKLVKKKKIFNEDNLLALHGIVLKDIEGIERGQYRTRSVFIGGAEFLPVPAFEVPARMSEFFSFYKKNKKKMNAIELAANLHYKLVFIHPFQDGNGRAARLVMNLILMRNDFPPAVILNNDRKKYYRRLKEADKGNLEPFVNFIARNVERSLDIYLKALKPVKEKKLAKEEEFISLKKATKYCPYSQEYLSLLARKGKLEATKLRRNWVTTKKAIKEYMEGVKK